MPTQNPRINIVLDDMLYQNVQFLANKENVSLSSKVRELLKEALELQEDIGLAEFAGKRQASWNESEALTHDDVWS
jgi:hypothetical protein